MSGRLAWLFAGLVTALPAAAQPPELRIPRTDRAPRLSSFSGAEIPHGVGEVSGFLQREPQDGTPSRVETTVYLSYDQARLYAVFVCRDDPAQVRARVTRREDAGSDDSVSLYLDTFHDRRRAYVFTSNPTACSLTASRPKARTTTRASTPSGSRRRRSRRPATSSR
ncbi:MAG: hypothetical protein R2708_17005 [Vicinamibacterales bacterium]